MVDLEKEKQTPTKADLQGRWQGQAWVIQFEIHKTGKKSFLAVLKCDRKRQKMRVKQH